VATLLSKSTEGKEKFREAESMLYELSRQLEMVKNTRIEQQTSNRATVSIENYEVVLNEKAKLENELSKMREKI
jgi:3-hydroxy-3-methylglutaryl CoA synthase